MSIEHPESKTRNRGGRPSAVVLHRSCYRPGAGADELADALREDIVEQVSALSLRVLRDEEVDPLAASRDSALVVTFDDVPALPALAVDAGIPDLEQADAVVGPCADGSLYLLILGPGLGREFVEQVLGLLREYPGAELGPLTELLLTHEVPTLTLPPWFRVGDESGLLFAETLARLSLCHDEGEWDFLADRLRVWFEKYT